MTEAISENGSARGSGAPSVPGRGAEPIDTALPLADWVTLAVWKACSGPPRRLRDDALCSTSRLALHYGIGEMHESKAFTIALKAGLRLGFVRGGASAE